MLWWLLPPKSNHIILESKCGVVPLCPNSIKLFLIKSSQDYRDFWPPNQIIESKFISEPNSLNSQTWGEHEVAVTLTSDLQFSWRKVNTAKTERKIIFQSNLYTLLFILMAQLDNRYQTTPPALATASVEVKNMTGIKNTSLSLENSIHHSQR